MELYQTYCRSCAPICTSLLILTSGRKWVIIFAISLFLVGSILCATAKSMDWLVAARVVQGLGGGGSLTLVTIIISDITTLRERPKYLAMGAFAWALGTNIGVRSWLELYGNF
jgi:MFS family permease